MGLVASASQPIRLIVSSKMIGAYFFKEARFTCPKPKEKHPYFRINGASVGVAQQAFEPFTVDANRMCRLSKVCSALEEQPVTLVWNGEYFWLEHFKI